MRRLLLVLAAACLCWCAAAQKTLTIVHVNDTHSHLDPVRAGRNAGLGGVVERAAFIDSVRVADGKKNVLLLHAGDFNQGTSYYTELHGDLEVDLINALGYDCVTLGNHEFDNGIEDLGRRVARIKCPVVCANYDFSPFEAGRYIKPYAIVRKAGMKIGIVGLLTDITRVVSREIADRLPRFDTVETLNKWAKYLKEEEKCDLVIALTHIGFSGEPGVNDTSLVPQVRNVDIIVGGHSHTFLKEPVYRNDLDGKAVPIVQDGEWGLQMGVLKVR